VFPTDANGGRKTPQTAAASSLRTA
jgi:hypothetical protein